MGVNKYGKESERKGQVGRGSAGLRGSVGSGGKVQVGQGHELHAEQGAKGGGVQTIHNLASGVAGRDGRKEAVRSDKPHVRQTKRALRGSDEDDDPVLGVRVEGWFDRWVRQMVALYNYKEEKDITKSNFVRLMLSKAAPLMVEEFKKKYGESPIPGKEMQALTGFGRWLKNNSGNKK